MLELLSVGGCHPLGNVVITPILHCKAKSVTQLISATKGKSGFSFRMCKIKVLSFLHFNKNTTIVKPKNIRAKKILAFYNKRIILIPLTLSS